MTNQRDVEYYNSRVIRSKKIIACLENFCTELQNKEVLEIGCGFGIIASEVSKNVKSVIACDFTGVLFPRVLDTEYTTNLPLHFVIGDGTSMPFRNNTFDIIICNHVLEHVNDHHRLLSEIYRVLKVNGLYYISTPNKLWPLESHTRLPFLSYLPRSVANKYVKRFKDNRQYYIRLFTYWNLRKILLNNFHNYTDITPMVIKKPKEFYCSGEIPRPISAITKLMPYKIIKMLSFVFPSWIIIGRKK